MTTFGTIRTHHCGNCGLTMEVIDGEWWHADGHFYCPPAFRSVVTLEKKVTK